MALFVCRLYTQNGTNGSRGHDKPRLTGSRPCPGSVWLPGQQQLMDFSCYLTFHFFLAEQQGEGEPTCAIVMTRSCPFHLYSEAKTLSWSTETSHGQFMPSSPQVSAQTGFPTRTLCPLYLVPQPIFTSGCFCPCELESAGNLAGNLPHSSQRAEFGPTSPHPTPTSSPSCPGVVSPL